MQLLRALTIVCISLLIISCGKDKAKLDNNLVTAHDGITKSNNCEELDLSQNLLKRNTVLNIFGCIGWDKEFPQIYNYLFALDESDFDLIFSPLNEKLFGTNEKRNNFLIFIQNKISKEEISKKGV